MALLPGIRLMIGCYAVLLWLLFFDSGFVYEFIGVIVIEILRIIEEKKTP